MKQPNVPMMRIRVQLLMENETEPGRAFCQINHAIPMSPAQKTTLERRN